MKSDFRHDKMRPKCPIEARDTRRENKKIAGQHWLPGESVLARSGGEAAPQKLRTID